MTGTCVVRPKAFAAAAPLGTIVSPRWTARASIACSAEVVVLFNPAIKSLNYLNNILAPMLIVAGLIKEQLKDETARAADLGIFGAPSFVTEDGEPGRVSAHLRDRFGRAAGVDHPAGPDHRLDVGREDRRDRRVVPHPGVRVQGRGPHQVGDVLPAVVDPVPEAVPEGDP